ncbi:MAG: protein kinase [Cyanosarcina radialis HA8281-LM2]|jgi:serine/threonine-protein kinase|nr:protein kinase [Cyanosarcina radialis HA8281-LM2]
MQGQILAGRYQIVKQLGVGRFHTTFLAEDRQQINNPHFTIKQFNIAQNDPRLWQKFSGLFQQVVEVVDKLGSGDRIAKIIGHFNENRACYLVEEFIEGHDLAFELRPGKRLSESYVMALLPNILEPLQFVHHHGIVHGNIAPSNLIRRKQDGKIVLNDLGVFADICTQIACDRDPHILFNSSYIPAEQLAGKPQFSSDIYAVGIIGIQALMGLNPQQLPKDPQTSEIIWRNAVQVNPGLGDILDKMVRYDFRQRYQSIPEVLQAVQREREKTQVLTTAAGYAPTLAVATNSPPTVPNRYRVETPSESPTQNFAVETIQNEVESPSWGFLFMWVLATLAGVAFGYALSWVAGFVVKIYVSETASYAIFGAIFGAVIGILQALILSAQFRHAIWWVLVTVAAGAISFPLGDAAYDIVSKSGSSLAAYGTFGVVVGAIAGILQSLVLRTQIHYLIFWVLATTASAASGFILATNLPVYGLSLGAGIFGLITGVILIWLWKSPSLQG